MQPHKWRRNQDHSVMANALDVTPAISAFASRCHNEICDSPGASEAIRANRVERFQETGWSELQRSQWQTCVKASSLRPLRSGLREDVIEQKVDQHPGHGDVHPKRP